MDIERARKYINSVRWQYAKTMPKNPHEYTVRKWCPALDLEFVWFVNEIRNHGIERRFFRQIYIYLRIDDKEYWTMGAPVDVTIIINRANANGVAPTWANT